MSGRKSYRGKGSRAKRGSDESYHTRDSVSQEDTSEVDFRRQTYERLQSEVSMPSTSYTLQSTSDTEPRTSMTKHSRNEQEKPDTVVIGDEDSSSHEDIPELELVDTTGLVLQRKRSLLTQTVDIESLTVNDDEKELLESRRSVLESSRNLEDEIDEAERLRLQQIAAMSSEELADRVFSCMRLCAENKINVKNAFNLHLIDWLPHLLKHKSPLTENFSTLACTLDASAKIYSHRVDIVHKEAMKIAEMIAPGATKKYGRDQKTKGGKMAAKKKKTSCVAKHKVLMRKRAGKNPLRKLVRVGGRPGSLTEAMVKTRKTLSTDTPYRPTLKLRSKGKRVPLKLKSHMGPKQIDNESLSRMSDGYLGIRRPKTESYHECLPSTSTAAAAKDSDSDDDLDMETLLALVDSDPAPEERKDLLEKVYEKIEQTQDNPEHFRNLSRMEKLGLVLSSEPQSFVNPHLETLLYGPSHLRRMRTVTSRRRQTGRGRTFKKKDLEKKLLDFHSESTSQQTTQVVKRKSSQQKQKIRRVIQRSQLTLRTLKNWSEKKTLGPEELVVDRTYMNHMVLRPDIQDAEDEMTSGTYELRMSIHEQHEVKYEEHSHEENSSDSEHSAVETSDENTAQALAVVISSDEESQADESGGQDLRNAISTEEECDAQVVNNDEYGTENGNKRDDAEECMLPQLNAGQSSNADKTSDSSICSLVDAPETMQVQPLQYSTTCSRVNMKLLKQAIKDVVEERLPNPDKENTNPFGEGTSTHQFSGSEEGAVGLLPGPANQSPNELMFADLLVQLPDRLDRNSAEDLTPQMAFLALLHVASDCPLMLTNDENHDNDIRITRLTDDYPLDEPGNHGDSDDHDSDNHGSDDYNEENSGGTSEKAT